MAAAKKVLSTTELLEAILIELPTRDLLLAQQVSKQWQSVVVRSVQLQKALFFKAVPGGTIFSWDIKEYGKVLKNPLLEPLFCLLNSVKAKSFQSTTKELFNLPGYVHSSWNEPNASWRSMLPTQPATIDLFNVYSVINYHQSKTGHFSRDTVRMGEIIDKIDKTMEDFWEPGAVTTISANNLKDYKTLQNNHELEALSQSTNSTAAPVKPSSTEEASESLEDAGSAGESGDDEDTDTDDDYESDESEADLSWTGTWASEFYE